MVRTRVRSLRVNSRRVCACADHFGGFSRVIDFADCKQAPFRESWFVRKSGLSSSSGQAGFPDKSEDA